jgi:phospholipid/cholesterol/gamma-HCH transport system permease protein
MESIERRDTVERRVPAQATERIQRVVWASSGRFISRGRLAASSMYWLAWIIVSPRAIVSAGVQREIEALGVGALRLVASASVLVGLITTFQVATQLTTYGAENMAGRAIGWFAARELGPLIVAVLIIARSAASTAGEFASMAAGGELDALRAMGLDPAKYLVAPKLAAFLVALPTLTVFADGLIVLGGWLGSSVVLGYSTQFFLEQFRSSFDIYDIFVGVAKALIFALVIGIVAADEGLSVRPHVESIGAAATRAVVFCLIGVLAADTLINAVFYFIPGLS